MQEFNFWQFMAGISVFVFAMSLVESSLKNLAGRSFKKFLQRQSRNKLKMIAASTLVTAVLQSSSVVLLMLLSFVGAGLISMSGALAAMLGSNLGTTLANWVIVLVGFKTNLTSVSYPVLAVALIGLLASRKNTRLYYLTTFLVGFAFIFISLGWLKDSAVQSIQGVLGDVGQWHYLVFVPLGFLVTAVIQSSSVTMVIALVALHNQLIPFESAVAIVIGAELGTTLKFLIGSVGGIPDKKRVAWGNFMLNFVTLIIATVFLQPFVYLVQQVFRIADPLMGLVVFQTSINLFSIFIFYPLLGVFAKFLDRFFRDSDDDITYYIRKKAIALPDDALELAVKETIHLMNEAMQLNERLVGVADERRTDWISSLKIYAFDAASSNESYHRLKMLQGEILEYVTEIPKDEMTKAELDQVGRLINITRHILRSAKNLKDIRHNLDEFESSANDNLFSLFSNVRTGVLDFYKEFRLLIKEPDKVNAEKVDALATRNRRQYEEAIAGMLVLLKEKKISELDSSSLLNVYHEVYASEKALIRALADLKDLDTSD
jgi:phosphate:Na+ symporter